MDRVISLLPFEIGNVMRLVKERVAEIRIRRRRFLAVTVISSKEGEIHFENRELGLFIHDALMEATVSALTQGSVYSYENTINEGYITVQGCCRIGVIGRAVCEDGNIKHLSRIDSLCIRISRDILNVSDQLFNVIEESAFKASLLVFSPPGCGKTTVLRDLAKKLATKKRVALIDSRCELVSPILEKTPHIDVLLAYPKAKGIEIAVRTLFPEYIICDEIGLLHEGEALGAVQNAGVPMIMTAHAASLNELFSRDAFLLFHRKHYFDHYASIDRLYVDASASFSVTRWEDVRI